MEYLNASNLVVIDDGSPLDDLAESFPNYPIIDAENLPNVLPKVCIVRFNEHLGRQSTNCNAGWWRSFSFSWKLVEKYGFDKVVHVESDAYIVSKYLADFINEQKSGWQPLFSEAYKFPETSIQIICKDTFDRLKGLYEDRDNLTKRELAEFCLPFTRVVRGFIGDRYGEPWCLRIPEQVDYICQGADLYIPKEVWKYGEKTTTLCR